MLIKIIRFVSHRVNATKVRKLYPRHRQYSAETPGTARPVPTRVPRPSHPLLSLLVWGGHGADLGRPPRQQELGASADHRARSRVRRLLVNPGATEAESTLGSSAPHTHSRVAQLHPEPQGPRAVLAHTHPASGSGAASQQGGHLGAAWAPGLHRPGLPSLLAGHRWVTAPAGTACTRTLAPGIVGVLGVGRGPPGTLGEDWAPSHPNAAPASLPQGTGRHGSQPCWPGTTPLCVHMRGWGGPRPSDSPAQAEAPVRSAAPTRTCCQQRRAQPHARLSSSSPAQGLGRTQAHH